MLTSDPNVLNESKIAWREKSKSIEPPTRTVPLTFMEHLAWLFLRILCASQSCKKGYEQDNDDRNDVNIQRIRIKSQDARSTRMETNAIFFLVFLVSFSPICIVYWLIYWLQQKTCCNDTEHNENVVSISWLSFPSQIVNPEMILVSINICPNIHA